MWTPDQVDDLLLSARYGDLQDLQQTLTPELLTAETVAGVKNDNDNTMLHYASANGHTDVVRFLLPALTLSALLAQNDAGNTALHWAGLNGHVNTVKLLVSTIEALESAHPDEAKRLNLIYHPSNGEAHDGAERKLWDVRNKAGRGPMSEAQMREQEAVVKHLLERMIDGPDLSSQTADLKLDS